MYSDNLKMELRNLAVNYSSINNLGIDKNHQSAVIFYNIKDNFLPDSFNNIQNKWTIRLDKSHTQVKGIKEMQSSNSSDALLMSIFCHPQIDTWSGILNLLGVTNFKNVEFGFKAKVKKTNDNKEYEDSTEIDFYIKDLIIAESKLTETDFVKKEKEAVKLYKTFEKIFHIEKLIQNDKYYHNYQLIRNILAAEQYNCRFILFCDMRRPDLIKSFYQTIRCIKDSYLELRTNCEILLWQDISNKSGKDLKEFLKVKYGI